MLNHSCMLARLEEKATVWTARAIRAGSRFVLMLALAVLGATALGQGETALAAQPLGGCCSETGISGRGDIVLVPSPTATISGRCEPCSGIA